MEEDYRFDGENLRHFFIISFAYSWMIWGIAIVFSTFTNVDLPPWVVFLIVIIGAFGPFVGSVWLTHKSGGKNAVISLLKGGLKIKEVPKLIWLAMFLIPMTAMLTAISLVWLGYGEGGLSFKGLLIFPFYMILMYLGGPLQEEFGWRGYALDRMQKKWNALVSSIILGIIWASWHIPLFFVEGAPQERMNMFLFFISVVSVSIVMTWLHNNSNSNVFVALTYHSIGNSIIIIADTEGVGQAAMSAGELYNVYSNSHFGSGNMGA
jgi:membrane protease YdiL (CAAX protease family)